MKDFVVSKVRLIAFLLLIAATCLSSSAYSQVSQQERDALIALYNSTDGDIWTDRTGWLGDPGTECTWYGITCINDSVTEILLDRNSLVGAIPAEIGDFASLRVLDLSVNRPSFFPPSGGITGPIPAEIGGLTNLEILNLRGDSGLKGPIPPEIGNLTKLKTLDLDSVTIGGSIPPELGNLSNLETLDLEATFVSGSIPSELGNLTGLVNLDLARNKLTGAIPSQLGNLTALKSLDLFDNFLTGPLPTELSGLQNLTFLLLSSNDLTGPIPSSFGSLASLIRLDLDFNQLTGPIPPELGNLNSLVRLELGFNQLTGSIPQELGNLSNLLLMDLGNNELSGALPGELGNLSSLSYLDLSNNQVTGTVSQSLIDNVELKLFLDGNASLTWWEGWPSPYNGITPNPALKLELNNIGVYNPDDQLIYVCLRVLSNGIQSSHNGVEQFGLAFEIISLDEGVIRVKNSRQFNKGNALNEDIEPPDCSGTFETTTNMYTDIVESDVDTYAVTFELFDGVNFDLRLVELKELLPQ